MVAEKILDKNKVELSVVIPCLNEADTLEICINQIKKILEEKKITGEIVVSDNGSSDGSIEIAKKLEVKIVHVKEKGYGNALIGGIEAASGKFILMGDADASYDFCELPAFLEKLRSGCELVMGCRLPSGGGKIMPGAMPLLHRWIGNPLFSFMVRFWFNAPIHDVHCGMRAFTKDLFNRLRLHCTGMEFASEMIIKASYFANKICEIPITLYPDKRKSFRRHLKTFPDGWRHLRFYLMYSPRWLFLIPGMLLLLFGLLLYFVVICHLNLFGRPFYEHTLLFGSLFIICGYQSVIFAILAKTFAINEGLKPEEKLMTKFWRIINLENGLIIGILSMLGGVLLLIAVIYKWKIAQYGALDTSITLRWLIPGVTLTALGFQTILFSFFASMLGLKKK